MFTLFRGLQPVCGSKIPSDTLFRVVGAAVGWVGSEAVFVKMSTRRNWDGTAVRYLQLAHNEWDTAAKTVRAKVLYSFGRADALDRAPIKRLIAALTRPLGTEPDTATDEAPIGAVDSRDDLPQTIAGMAVTRQGTRCGCGPGRLSPIWRTGRSTLVTMYGATLLFACRISLS